VRCAVHWPSASPRHPLTARVSRKDKSASKSTQILRYSRTPGARQDPAVASNAASSPTRRVTSSVVRAARRLPPPGLVQGWVTGSVTPPGEPVWS
jgi:hypothetical protein